ncbi:MAG: Glycerol-3-phosphate ABC transporter, ATP-binding protein UgpC [Candidatus Kapaibacterium sp.]|nr:MAG: Glycerol-3-phosphate ABC transporter, ATP-binding protein UgpC [Candidatus Kapabacteria bacterium]
MKEIKLIQISKEFNNRKVLEDISFEANEEEFVVLVGPSGCGKTTILRIIAGLESPTSGKIYFNDSLWNEVPPGERKVGMVFQNYALYPHFSVFENLAFPLKVQKVDKSTIAEKVRKVAEMLNLTEKLNNKPKELSGGERQRVALGRAIIREPNVFLFDEPLSNLDAKLRVLMRAEIVNLCKKLKTPSIYVTHDQIEALTMGSKIVVLNQGKIQQVGTPNEIYYRPANTFVATFIGTPQMNLFQGFIQEGKFFEKNGLFQFSLKQFNNYSGNLIIGIRPEDIYLTSRETSIINTTVKATEYIGYETLVYFEHQDKLYSIILDKNHNSPREGEQINLAFKTDFLHFFDKEGKRIELDTN